ASSLTLDGVDSSNAISGVVAGGGSITKNGADLWVFKASNKYTGLTTINAGALALDDPQGLGTTTGGTIVNAGGVLVPNALQGANVFVPEPITLNGQGNSLFPGALAIATTGGNVTLTGVINLGSASTIASNVASSSAVTIQ